MTTARFDFGMAPKQVSAILYEKCLNKSVILFISVFENLKVARVYHIFFIVLDIAYIVI